MDFVINFIVDKFYYVFLGGIVLSLVEKHRGRGHIKRMATIYQSIMVFVIYITAMFIQGEGLNNNLIFIPIIIVAGLLYFFRSKTLPYALRCRNCGAKLNSKQIFMYDSNLCENCDPIDIAMKEEAEAISAAQAEDETDEGEVQPAEDEADGEESISSEELPSEQESDKKED